MTQYCLDASVSRTEYMLIHKQRVSDQRNTNYKMA